MSFSATELNEEWRLLTAMNLLKTALMMTRHTLKSELKSNAPPISHIELFYAYVAPLFSLNKLFTLYSREQLINLESAAVFLPGAVI